MKLTKQELKKIIQEEKSRILSENHQDVEHPKAKEIKAQAIREMRRLLGRVSDQVLDLLGEPGMTAAAASKIEADIYLALASRLQTR